MNTKLTAITLIFIAACGSPISQAANCTELTNVVTNMDRDTIDVDLVFIELGNRADELFGQALASGADSEAMLCAAIRDEVRGAALRNTFEEIGKALNP